MLWSGCHPKTEGLIMFFTEFRFQDKYLLVCVSWSSTERRIFPGETLVWLKVSPSGLRGLEVTLTVLQAPHAQGSITAQCWQPLCVTATKTPIGSRPEKEAGPGPHIIREARSQHPGQAHSSAGPGVMAKALGREAGVRALP